MLLYQDHLAVARPPVVYALAFSPDGSALASAATDGSVILRDFGGDRRLLNEPGPDAPAVQAVAFTADGTGVFLGGSAGWHGRRFNGTTWEPFGPSNPTPVSALGMLDDRTLAVGVGDRVKSTAGKLELWDVVTGARRSPYWPEPNGVRAMAVCPGKRVVAWTGYNKARVWDIVKARPIDFPQQKPCPAVGLSPDGKSVAVAVDYAARVYGIEKRQLRLELRHKAIVSAVAFSPDGATVATGSWDNTVKLWDAATGQERTAFRWPIGRVLCLAYAPDGLRLAAGGDLGSVVVWDTE